MATPPKLEAVPAFTLEWAGDRYLRLAQYEWYVWEDQGLLHVEGDRHLERIYHSEMRRKATVTGDTDFYDTY